MYNRSFDALPGLYGCLTCKRIEEKTRLQQSILAFMQLLKSNNNQLIQLLPETVHQSRTMQPHHGLQSSGTKLTNSYQATCNKLISKDRKAKTVPTS
jgi:hypothetical protein